MKIAASVISWIEGVAGLATLITLLCIYEPLFAFIGFIIIVPRLGILIWREISVRKGYKIACGICTLIFCSEIGGILTLCIPDYQLYNYDPSKGVGNGRYTKTDYNRPSVKPLSPLERAALLDKLEKQLQNGEITKEEYDKKRAKIR